MALTILSCPTSSARSLHQGGPQQGPSKRPRRTLPGLLPLNARLHLSETGCLHSALPRTVLRGANGGAGVGGVGCCLLPAHLACKYPASSTPCGLVFHTSPNKGGSSEVCSWPCDPRCHDELHLPSPRTAVGLERFHTWPRSELASFCVQGPARSPQGRVRHGALSTRMQPTLHTAAHTSVSWEFLAMRLSSFAG